jgi:hypothetical protein
MGSKESAVSTYALPKVVEVLALTPKEDGHPHDLPTDFGP